MNTIIISATRERDIQKTLLYKSLLPLKSKATFDFFFFTENKDGLSVVYNKAIAQFKDYDCIVFTHDDVYLDDAFFVDKIEDGFSEYDIIGVAGGYAPKLQDPALWHLMCKSENLRGSAGHFSRGSEDIFITSFGTTPARVTLLDGVFLGVNMQKVKQTGWKFNENYDFHLYDLSSCLDANAKKLKLGVLPIHIIHQSPGLSDINNPTFQKNNKQFLKEYSS